MYIKTEEVGCNKNQGTQKKGIEDSLRNLITDGTSAENLVELCYRARLS
jgi:hypothetical protein